MSETPTVTLSLENPAPPASSGNSDVVPPPAPTEGSKRMSSPRLSIGRHGAPALDFNPASGTGDENVGAIQMIFGLFAVILGLACCAGGVACTVFTIIFLVDDENKSECWDGAGKAIWTYVIVRLVLGCCSSQCTQTAQSQDVEPETAAAGACCSAMIVLTLFIYGGVVLIAEDVCDGFKRTGLYQMYYILYIIDVVFNSLLLCSIAPVIMAACSGEKSEPRLGLNDDNEIAVDA